IFLYRPAGGRKDGKILILFGGHGYKTSLFLYRPTGGRKGRKIPNIHDISSLMQQKRFPEKRDG
ncbi:MAG: hypothetical protein K1W26_12755, partial [Acetatifactor sp.]